MPYRGLSLLLLCLPLTAWSGPSLFHYDDQATAALAEVPAETLVEDGQRVVRVDPMALLEGGELNLPDGHRYRLVPLDITDHGDGDFTWRGALHDEHGRQGTATVTRHGGHMAGRFRVAERLFELRPVTPASQLLLEHDPAAFPRAHPPGGPVVEEEQAVQAMTTADEDEPVADVLLFYTEEALAQMDSEGSLRASIRNALESGNTVLFNSESDYRFRVVALKPLEFGESDDARDDLGRLRDSSEVRELRDRYAADLVALISNHSGAGICGIAYMGAGAPSSGFSITRRACLGNETLAHELGHNLGFAHDPDNAEGSPATDYAYGHRRDGEFRTVMAYADGCHQCPQIEHFSNPRVSTDAGFATGIEDERDNIRALTQTGPQVAAYRSPPLSLGEALNAPSLEWETGGSALWRAQEEVTRDDQAVPRSGPLYGGESSWLETRLDAPALLSFEWLSEFGGASEVELVVEANGERVEGFRDDEGDWTRSEVAIEAVEPRVRWRVRSPSGSDFGAAGHAFLANVTREDSEGLSGRTLNQLGQGLDEVTVSFDGETRQTSAEGDFAMVLPEGSVGSEDELDFQGTGLVSASRPAEECLEDAGPCEQVLEGEPRTVSGRVEGLLAGESVSMQLHYLGPEGESAVAESRDFTVSGDGEIEFSLDADSSVHYSAVVADVAGFRNNRHEPEEGIRLREGDLSDVSIQAQPREPAIRHQTVSDTGESSASVSAEVSTHGRSAEVILFYGEGALDQEKRISLETGVDEYESIRMTVDGLACGRSHDWRLRVESELGTARETAIRSFSTEDCPDSGSDSGTFGCHLGPTEDVRPDPLLWGLLLMAVAGLLRARARPDRGSAQQQADQQGQ